MTQFPIGWRSANLFDICEPRQWKTISTKDLTPKGYTVYGANGIIGFYSDYTHEHPTLMITCRGATCGNLHVSKPFSYINGNAMALDDLNEAVCSQKYLHAYLRGRGFEDVISGSAQPQITREGLRKVEVPLAPLPEQKRIAEKLDTVLARVDACRDRLDRIPALLKRFRQSILAAATSGRLTEDWRANGSPDEVKRNPGIATDTSTEAVEIPSWTPQTIGALCDSSFYGPRFGKGEYTDSDTGIPTIRTTDMTDDGRIEVTESTPRVSVPANRIEDFKVRRGDLLVTRTGSIGVMAVFDEDYLAIPSAYLIRFRFKTAVAPRYAFFCLTAPRGQEALGLSSTAITQPNVNAEAIKRIGIDLPPMDEQHEIVRRVETLFAFADRLEARLATARKQAGQLTPALLAKAFRGELVPQDPNDEPATELLKRLATQRDATPKPKRGRKAGA